MLRFVKQSSAAASAARHASRHNGLSYMGARGTASRSTILSSYAVLGAETKCFGSKMSATTLRSPVAYVASSTLASRRFEMAHPLQQSCVRTFSSTGASPSQPPNRSDASSNETSSSVNSSLSTDAVPASLFSRVLSAFKMQSPSQIVVKNPEQSGFNRYTIVPAAILTQLSLGSIFAWSIYNQPLTHLQGVVAAAASDWTLAQIMPVFSTTMACFGVSCAVLGRAGLYEKLGPRVTGVLGAGLYLSSFSVGALAVELHSLPLLYLGCGIMGGITMGITYVPPISTLIKWFPDRKGIAAAFAVMGFGAGGMVAAPCIERLLKGYASPPKMVDPALAKSIVNVDGRLFVKIGESLHEVVMATQAGLTRLGSTGVGLSEGAYLVGTGSTGLTMTFLTLGACYATLIGLSAFVFKLPPDGYFPLAATPVATGVSAATPAAGSATAALMPKPRDFVAVGGNVTASQAMKLPQFWLVWAGMCFNSTAAYMIIGAGKTMMTDIFSGAYPLLVTSAFAATFVSMISMFNLGGRLVWGTISDNIGTNRTFTFLWGLGIPLYLCMPIAAHMLPTFLADGPLMDPSMMQLAPLGLFYLSCMLAISTFGGSAAVCPAYASDLFGSKYVGAIHGQILSFLILGGYLGPLTCSVLREYSLREALASLSSKVDPALFQQTFGAPISSLEQLISTKTVTIARLLELLPTGTQDPTPFLYDNTMIAMAGFQVLGLACNLLIRKVDPKHFEVIVAPVKAGSVGVAANATAAASGGTVIEIVNVEELEQQKNNKAGNKTTTS